MTTWNSVRVQENYILGGHGPSTPLDDSAGCCRSLLLLLLEGYTESVVVGGVLRRPVTGRTSPDVAGKAALLMRVEDALDWPGSNSDVDKTGETGKEENSPISQGERWRPREGTSARHS